MKKKKNIFDLINDPSFKNWANHSNEKDVEKWEAWKTENPDEQALLEDTKMMMNGFNFKKSQISDDQVNDSWSNFASKLEQQNAQTTKVVSLKYRWLKIAAALLVLVVALIGFQKFNTEPSLISYNTGQHETKSIELPDGSIAILNTNSKISYTDAWLDSEIRQLNLEGEAYFKVKKQPKGTVFQVISNKLQVEVIGTAFNFNEKRAEPIVSLTEGKVKLIKPNKKEKLLIAGETAWFNAQKNDFEIQTKQTDYWRGWTMQKWNFGDGISIVEVLERIQETYGLTYEITDPKILEKKASGEIVVENQAVLLEALSVLLSLEMKVKGNQLVVDFAKEED